MNRIEVTNQFNKSAASYDEHRKKLIPCFDDFYSIPISLMEKRKTAPSILDIGAGTGLLSMLVKEAFPTVKITLIDLSAKMLDIARDRFANQSDITFVEADYTQYLFDEPFDFILSSLSIHHLENEEKKALFANCYSWLMPGGRFINADQVLGDNSALETFYKQDWLNRIAASGLSKKAIDAAIERTKLDKMAPLGEQLKWMKETGFSNVDCVYKYYNFTVMTGEKNK